MLNTFPNNEAISAEAYKFDSRRTPTMNTVSINCSATYAFDFHVFFCALFAFMRYIGESSVVSFFARRLIERLNTL